MSASSLPLDLIRVEHVSKRFPLPDGKGDFTVLGDVSLSVHRGEVLALLGRSGSGKSTLLRIMSGLIRPSQGEVLSNGKPLRGANPNLAMVFQSFALLPWLTVQDNVELGLAARHVPPAERRERALKAIDIVGLDGFENAYPKELSGGMKQRVGFARAFVLEPEVLFMDEPFSALDVLTAENLRGEIDDLWNAGSFPSSSILIVTHNIEEAVYLADRIVILGSNPGRIRGETHITISNFSKSKQHGGIKKRQQVVDLQLKTMGQIRQRTAPIRIFGNKLQQSADAAHPHVGQATGEGR